VEEGLGEFVDTHTIQLAGTTRRITADVILIATGSIPARLPGVPFDDHYVFDSDTIVQLQRTPQSILIQGGGIIGVEYAFIFRALGAAVTLVEFVPELLQMLDDDIRQAVLRQLQQVGVRCFTNSVVEFVSVPQGPRGEMELRVVSRSDQTVSQTVHCEAFMAATGRRGNTRALQLPQIAGLRTTRTGCVEVHPLSLWTGVEKIYAAGDCAGLSAFQPHGLVTSGQAQAIRAVYSAFVNEWPSPELRSDYFDHGNKNKSECSRSFFFL
jgi:NAD(P) transhydrogenase